jgi:transposase
MIPPELVVEIRRLFYAEHWKIGTIASELGVHYDTVKRALEAERFRRGSSRKTKLEPYHEFIQQTLETYPRLRATRVFEMVRERGYTGGIEQLRRYVRGIRPPAAEVFVRLQVLPAEQAQVDWAHFGVVRVGRAERRLSCFVLTLSYSRAFYLEFFFDQSLENFLTGQIRAFHDMGGSARTLIYDNLKAAVIERYGPKARFNPKLLELCAHYHYQPQLCSPHRANEKGRVERTIGFIRQGFFEGRPFTNLADFNRRALEWRDRVMLRPHPERKPQTVLDVFLEEKTHLLPLPAHPFVVERLKPVRCRKTIYIRFDLNDYSIPPQAVGKKLTLAASDTRVRILDGPRLLASHRRSYDREEVVKDPAHEKALYKLRRKARSSTALERLTDLVPAAETFLRQAFDKGESARNLTQKLLLLLDDYGKDDLQLAIETALERNTPRLSSVAFVLNNRRTASTKKPPLPVQLEHRPDLAEIYVKPHSPEVYDELSESNSDQKPQTTASGTRLETDGKHSG